MISRRLLLTGALSLAASTSMPFSPAIAHKRKRKPFKLAKRYHPTRVRFSGYQPGTIVVDARNHFLYLIDSRNRALRYAVGVGKAGLTFRGTATISRKAKWPSWTPTANMIRKNPGKYARYAGGVPGGKNNPLGARALYLYDDGRDTLYRIHGTNEPWSIGKAVSSGCIRLFNQDIIDLYDRVQVGAEVVVL